MRLRLALGGVPAGRVEPGLEPRVALHRVVAHVVVGARHRTLGLAHRAHDLVEAARREDAVHRERVEVTRARILRQVADLPGADDLPARGLGLPRQRLGECRLARAVASDQTDPVPGGDAERRLLEQHACADAQLDGLGSDHLTVSSEFAALALDAGTNASKSTTG